MSMIERVAQAIATAYSGDPSCDWTCFTDEARAAIEAMREPTDEIADAMNDVAIDGPGYVSMNASLADCRSLFIAGIAAALKGEAE